MVDNKGLFMKKIRLFVGVLVLFAFFNITFGRERMCAISQTKDHVFHEYDIRGTIDKDFMVDDVYDIGKALACYFLEKNPRLKTVAIGMDGRKHSPIIRDLLVSSLTDSGLKVVFIGKCTTPVMYFAMHTQPFDAGLMITASHNGKEDNGLKICLGKTCVWGKELQVVKKYFKQRKGVFSRSRGSYYRQDMVKPYIEWMCNHFSHLKNIDTSFVIDCGNGAAGFVIPELIKEMGWKNVHTLYADVDGDFPNHIADPTVEENMQDVKKFLQENESVEFGLGFDGDVDRMDPMTKGGYLLGGDQLAAIYYNFIKDDYPGAVVVFGIKSSSGPIELLKKWGARPYLSATGHTIIKDQIKKRNAVVAAEISCHLYFADRYFGFDDGVYAMLRLIEIINETGKTLEELLEILPERFSTKEYRISCPEDKKSKVVAAVLQAYSGRENVDVNTIDGVRATMDYGWGLVRASNTQPVICLRFEANTKEDLYKVRDEFAEILEQYYEKDFLDKELAV